MYKSIFLSWVCVAFFCSTLFAVDAFVSSSQSSYQPIADLAPTNFQVSGANNDVSLAWDNPSASTFAGVSIRRSSTGYPNTLADGTAIADSLTESTYTDTALPNGTYYYSLFGQDETGNFSDVVTASITMNNPIPTQFSATNYEDVIALTFTMPTLNAGVQANHVQLFRSEQGFPEVRFGPGAHFVGSLVFSAGTIGTVIDSAVVAGTTYYYSAFTGTSTGYTLPATATVTARVFENQVDLEAGPGFVPVSGVSLTTVYDVVVDDLDNIYISEPNAGRVRKFGPTWRELFSLTGLTSPYGLSLDTHGNLYIAESAGAGRLLKVKTDGSDMTTVGTVAHANNVYVDADDNRYVSSAFHQLIKYTAAGDIDTTWGTDGVISIAARSMRSDGADGLYVTYPDKIVHISSDGKTVTDFIGGLTFPTGLDIDDAGNVYTFEKSGRLRKYTSQGDLLATLTETNRNGYSISVDRHNRIFVTELGWSYAPLQIFTQDNDAISPAAPTALSVTADGSDVTLSWTNPDAVDFWTTTVRRSTSSYPMTPTAGIAVLTQTTGNSVVDTVLNGTHYYSIFAQDLNFNVSLKATANIVVQVAAPDTPVLTAIPDTVTKNATRLSWTASSHVQGFTLTRSRDNGAPTVISQSLSAELRTWTDSDLEDAMYVYRLSAVDAAGNTSNAGIASVTIDTVAPQSPTLSVVTSGNRNLLSWTIPEGVHHFVLTRVWDGETTTLSATLSAGTTSYLDKVYDVGAYVYRIFAVDAYGNMSQETPTLPVAGYTRWFDASALSVNPGAAVLSWRDLSVNEGNALANTAASAPTYLQDAGTETSLGALQFTVGQSLTFATIQSIRAVFSIFKGAGSVLGHHGVNVFERPNQTNPSTPLWKSSGGGGPAGPAGPAGPPGGAGPVVTAGKTYVNGNLVNGTTFPMPIALHNGYNLIELRTAGVTSAGGLNLAGPGGPGGNQSVGELLIYDRLLSTGEQLRNRAYLMAKWFDSRSGGTPYVTATVSEIGEKALVENPQIDSGEIVVEEEVTEPVVAPKIGISGTATLNLNNGYRSEGTEIGVNNGAKGTLVLANNAAAWRDTGDVVIGKSGEGQVIQSSGVVEITGKIVLGQEAGSSGNYTFAGGRLSAGALELSTVGNSTFDWIGGALQIPSVIGNLTNKGGTLEVVGHAPMTIVGNYAQTAAGTMKFTISEGSETQSLQRLSSRLSSEVTALISSTGTIDAGGGTLTITLDSFAPALNTVVTVFSPPPTGTFSTVNLPDLDAGLMWDQSQLYSQGILTVVASSSDLLVSRPLNAPNPFVLREGSMLGYALTKAADIELRVYRSSGNEILRKTFTSGVHEGAKLGYNRVMLTEALFGQSLSAGIYPYLLISDGKVVGKGKFAIMPE